MTKVFRKTSGNGHITLFLAKRNFVDYVDSVEVVDGVIKVEPSGLNGRKVFVHLACTFHYGSDNVIGVALRKNIWIESIQVYPSTGENKTKSPTLESLLRKAGEHGCPFSFQMPTNLPCSVALQPGPNSNSQAYGVEFEVKGYIATAAVSANEVIDKKDTCHLMIRKIQFAPADNKPGFKVCVCKRLMTDKTLHLDASLEREIYYHGDPVTVNIKVNNETTKVVKKIKVSIEQLTNVVLYSSDTYIKTVCSEESVETINVNSTFEKSFQITPLLSNNKDKWGLAMDGCLKDEKTHLASTTLNQRDNEMQGIFVSYQVKVSLVLSGGGLLGGLKGRDVTVELPLTLMSPVPAGDSMEL
ncbi:arrestin 3b, retinal (X-arrestin) [Betta splendens]|uniref:Arrestin-C n=1 Tax=Betta splendens TaxID=158456 RepID=A0A6P7NKK0_BETSP|nr:arrestin 3b, retinal (X-arrestin) [Betta splendens]